MHACKGVTCERKRETPAYYVKISQAIDLLVQLRTPKDYYLDKGSK